MHPDTLQQAGSLYYPSLYPSICNKSPHIILLLCRHYHGPLLSQLVQAGASKKLLESMSVAQMSKLLQCVALLAPDAEGVFTLFSTAAKVRDNTLTLLINGTMMCPCWPNPSPVLLLLVGVCDFIWSLHPLLAVAAEAGT